jgi:hypothetical protein
MRKELGSCCTWAIAYALAGLLGNLVSIAVFDFYDPVHWPILLLPCLALFLPALAPLALVHIAHLRPRIRAGAAMAVPIAGLGGAVALIAFFAFYTDTVLNWREPYWATLLPRRLQLAAAIPPRSQSARSRCTSHGPPPSISTGGLGPPVSLRRVWFSPF